MKKWQKKSKENKYCFGSHSIQARILDKYVPNADRACTKLATMRLMKRKYRKKLKEKS